jgi:hypothetical protein
VPLAPAGAVANWSDAVIDASRKRCLVFSYGDDSSSAEQLRIDNHGNAAMLASHPLPSRSWFLDLIAGTERY